MGSIRHKPRVAAAHDGGILPTPHLSRSSSPNTPLIQVSDATGNRTKKAPSDQNWAASLQETHMAQFQLSVEHGYGPNDLPSLQSLGSVHFYIDPGVFTGYQL